MYLAVNQRIPRQLLRAVHRHRSRRLSARDLTPEALRAVADRHLPGLAEMLRSLGAQHTPFAWLGRGDVVQVGGMLVFALPGSPRAAKQSMDMLSPLLAHALAMVDGQPHA